jgi:hypothetical protein
MTVCLLAADLVQMHQPIAGATDDNYGGHGPEQQYGHVSLLRFLQIDNSINCQLFPNLEPG